MAPLLVILKDTEGGGREGAAEKAMEWRQKMDLEGEEQPGSTWLQNKPQNQKDRLCLKAKDNAKARSARRSGKGQLGG